MNNTFYTHSHLILRQVSLSLFLSLLLIYSVFSSQSQGTSQKLHSSSYFLSWKPAATAKSYAAVRFNLPQFIPLHIPQKLIATFGASRYVFLCSEFSLEFRNRKLYIFIISLTSCTFELLCYRLTVFCLVTARTQIVHNDSRSEPHRKPCSDSLINCRLWKGPLS